MAEVNPKDLCSECGSGQIQSNAPLPENKPINNSAAKEQSDGSLSFDPFEKNAKKAIDNIFDPLVCKGGHKKPYEKFYKYYDCYKIEDDNYKQKYQEVYSYELVNLDPNNEFDFYYRDDDPAIWNKNRKATSNKINENLTKLHFDIVEPIRTRVRMVFGDLVFVKVELAFMSPAALVKYRLKSTHWHAQGRAVLLRIEGERASAIYEDIIDWVKHPPKQDDFMDYAVTEAQKNLKPIDYGLLKLCNTDSKDQFIYITLPFSKRELEEDELLIHNKSNFYYTEANAYKMAPEPDTSTKIFPAYYPDNEVEDTFNKIDDLDDEINKANKALEEAYANKKSKDQINKLKNEKSNLDFEKNKLLFPSNKPDKVLEKEHLEQIYKDNPSELNKNNLNKIKDEINRYPQFDDIFIDVLNKIDNTQNIYAIQDSIKDINLYKDYFNARKLVALKIALDHRNIVEFKPNMDVIEQTIKTIESTRQSVVNQKQKELYNISAVEALEESVTSDAKIKLPLDVDYTKIDMSDFIVPTVEELVEKQKKNFDESFNIMQKAYDTNDFVLLESVELNFKLDQIKYTELEYNDMEMIEYKKFPSLKNLVKECERYKEILLYPNKTRNVNEFDDKTLFELLDINLSKYIKDNNFNEEFYCLLDDKSDFNSIQAYFLTKKYNANKDIENITIKIEKSNYFSSLVNKNNFDITLIPETNSSKYAEFVMKYLDMEINMANHFKEDDRNTKLNKYKEQWTKDISEENYNNINLDLIKSDVYLFTDIEYFMYKSRKMIDISLDENKNIDDRILNKLGSLYETESASLEENVVYKVCSNTGKSSFKYQLIYKILNDFLNNKDEWLKENNFNLPSNDLLNQMKYILSYIETNILRLNEYIELYNTYIMEDIYSDDINFQINRKYKEFYRSYNFIDYGTEFISLNEKIGELSKKQDTKDNQYNIKLMKDRLKRKRTLEYIILDENNKKIKNYEDEMEAALEFGNLNKVNDISTKILPELNRLNELHKEYEKVNNDNSYYEIKKKIKKDRRRYFYEKDPTNKYLMYRYVTSDISMDFLNEQGIFKNSFLSGNEKYIQYMEETIKAIDEFGNSLLLSERNHLLKEIAFVKNENNEKKKKQEQILKDIKEKKERIERELNRRVFNSYLNLY